MADSSTDILMKVVGPAGPVRTDSRVNFDQQENSGKLLTGFQALFMSELRDFSFAVGAPSSLSTSNDEKTAIKSRIETPDMQPVEFTRDMDSASVRLLHLLTSCTTLPSISIVKRKAAGARNGGEAYLRLDFSEVLLIGLSWKESNDLVEETGAFIYRKLKVTYRPQAADGSLQSEVAESWAMAS